MTRSLHLSSVVFGLFSIGFFSGCSPSSDTVAKLDASATTGDIVATDEAPPSQSGPSASAVEVGLSNYDELQETIKGLAGKVVVVDIWSTSCLPCMQEFPNLVELSKKDPQRLACISLNVDFMGLRNETPESHIEEVKSFLEKQQAAGVINFVASEPDSDILEKYEVESMPAIIIIDPAGKLVAKATDSNASSGGLSYENDVLPKVEELLAAPAP